MSHQACVRDCECVLVRGECVCWSLFVGARVQREIFMEAQRTGGSYAAAVESLIEFGTDDWSPPEQLEQRKADWLTAINDELRRVSNPESSALVKLAHMEQMLANEIRERIAARRYDAMAERMANDGKAVLS